jgi:hypothetical protein
MEASIALIGRSLEQFFFSQSLLWKDISGIFKFAKSVFCAQKQFMFAFVTGTFNSSSKRVVFNYNAKWDQFLYFWLMRFLLPLF